ncbi:MAG: DUF3857 domain-containing protein [Cyclobacteriaceae bacterium]|nr:DUF3857 domain-containing protein [Cyclobacteriaceae bacterium]
MEDLKMTSYTKDSSAAAVVLADYGESSLIYSQSDGFTLKFERILRIKILTKDGLDYANFTIPLYHSGSNDEKLTGLKAVTYNLENGKVVETKMKGEGILKEKLDANVNLTKITLPNVKEGSVIEIAYGINSDFVFNFQDWEFQGSIPKRWSEYRARIPEYFHYDKYSQGYVVFDINEHTQAAGVINITSKERSEGRVTQTTFSNDKIDYTENRYRWVAKDVPAFKAEPFITTERNYISKINFELASTKFPNQASKIYMGSWADINKQYWESSDFGGEVTGNGFLNKTVDEITAGVTEPEKKLVALSNYVKQNITWDGYSRRFTTKPLRKVLEEKKGNSAEINLLLASMLNKAGLTANPVLISTRDHGFVREQIPVSSQFNYVVCMAMIDNKPVLLDATEKLLPAGALPERCLNGSGLVISGKGHSWVSLQASVKSRSVSNSDFSLLHDGILNGKLVVERSGFDGLRSRKKYFSKSEDEYVKDFIGTRPWEVSSKEISNTKEIHLPVKETYDITISEAATVAGDIIYINPILFDRIEENPFKLENRQYPVDYSSAFDRVYISRITLPEGFQVDELPKPKVISLPENTGKYTYSVSMIGEKLNVISNLQINKSIFSQDEYVNLREFYNQVVAKESEQVVLKRK